MVKVCTCDNTYSDDAILRFAALVEQKSEHPLGKAICKFYADKNGRLTDVSDFKMTAAKGVSETVNGTMITVGKLIGELDSADKARVDEQLSKSATVVYVHAEGKPVGFIALSDVMREDAARTVKKLKAVGITPMLLTGDNASAANNIAKSVGIETVHTDLLPKDKMQIIKGYSDKGEAVCMIGDGVNDALALTSADAGIAMGGIGSDIAIESADAVLVSDEIKRLPYLFDMMQRVMKKIKVNIIASLVINLSAVILCAFGVLTPITGALWHNFGSVFVVVNAALLLSKKGEE